MDHFPRDWGENKTYLKPPPSNASNLERNQKKSSQVLQSDLLIDLISQLEVTSALFEKSLIIGPLKRSFRWSPFCCWLLSPFVFPWAPCPGRLRIRYRGYPWWFFGSESDWIIFIQGVGATPAPAAAPRHHARIQPRPPSVEPERVGRGVWRFFRGRKVATMVDLVGRNEYMIL